MGFLSGVMGHATEVDIQDIREEFTPMLVDGEEISTAYKLVRDTIVFTNKRMIFVDKQGLTGKKVQYETIPYSKILRFSKESAGFMDLDAELRIWVHGRLEPIDIEFKESNNVNDIYRILSEATLA
ncbi:MAG: PH domain-containing protein [Chloroflexota bacterium]|nr:PH domain-containing protein [Chloroflexota bacterium]